MPSSTARLHRPATAATLLLCATAVQAAGAAPPFDVAYRAWEIVTQLARSHQDPAIAGTCATTFQAAAVPALRRQTPQEQESAARACVAAARAACANPGLRRTGEVQKMCGEFR